MVVNEDRLLSTARARSKDFETPVLAEPLPKPIIWALASYRAGENSQVFGLAERLGFPFRKVELSYRRRAGIISLLRRADTAGVANLHELNLAPPWPDLIISSGMKNEPLCRWIRKQSGGRTRLVFIGRTWAPASTWDLLVTTPQYRVKPAPSVLQNSVTLHGIREDALAAALDRHAGTLGQLPSPRIAVMVGGTSGPHSFGAQTASHLADQLEQLSRETGGYLMVSTSSRTPRAAIDVLRERLAANHYFYEWRPRDPDNPYLGLMAYADEIVVTSDSVAMLSEAAATGKPVQIFDLDAAGSGDHTLQTRLYRAMMRYGPARWSRDLGLFHHAFVTGGYGSWLGQERRTPSVSPEAEIARTVIRVRQLLKPDAALNPATAVPAA